MTTTTTTSANLDQLRNKATATLGEVGHDIENAGQQIRCTASDAVDAVKSDMQKLIESAKASGKADLAAAAERLSGYASTIADSASALQKKTRETVNQVATNTDTYVHDKPWQSVAVGVGVGAAIGFALGCMTARR